MYERRVGMVDRLVAGLGGIVVLVSAQLAAAPPPSVVTAITLTLAVLTGGAFGIAHVEFEYAATTLNRRVQKSDPAPEKALKPDDTLGEEDRVWPLTAELPYRAGLALLLGTTTAFLVGVWMGI